MMPNNPLSRQRDQAKMGMAIALGALVGTGFMARMLPKAQADTARLAHVVAGVSLVGLSYWHWSLYHRDKAGKGRA